MPEYVPDRIDVDASGLVYLLSASAHTVYRYAPGAREHRRPLTLRSQGTAGLTPLAMAVVNGRLYLGYDDGSISRFDTRQPLAGETEHARLSQRVVAQPARSARRRLRSCQPTSCNRCASLPMVRCSGPAMGWCGKRNRASSHTAWAEAASTSAGLTTGV